MKKEIVINASKDRSRIAIVEDGELVELYVETPDNVRSIGNVYLASIQKVMPALRAAFVDVGQKQDCFLHFSDLTDNLPQLLALAGEDVPGLDEPVLSLAPPKRVADDEDEPDPEETLEIEPEPEESRSRRTSRRRSRGRGRGRGRGKGREEEEEQEESPRRALPSVIDLSGGSKPRRGGSRTEARKSEETDADEKAEQPTKPTVKKASKEPASAGPSDASSPDASAPVEEAAPDKKPTRRRSRKRDDDTADAAGDAAPDNDQADAADASSSTGPADGPASEDETTDSADQPGRKRRRRGRRGGRGKSSSAEGQDAQDQDAETDDQAEETTSDTPDKGRSKRKRSAKPAQAGDADAADDGDGTDAAEPKGRGRRRRSSTSDQASSEASGSETAPAEGPSDTSDSTSESSSGSDAPAKSRGSKRLPATLDLTSGGKRPSAAAASEDEVGGGRRSRPAPAEDEASESGDETSPRGFKKPSSRRSRDADPDAADDQGSADAPDDAESETKGRRSRGRRSRGGAGGGDTATGDAPETSEESTDADGEKESSSGRSRGRRKGGRSSDNGSDAKEAGDKGAEATTSGGRSGRGSNGRGGRSPGRSQKIPSNEELLKRDGRIIVKITKEAISNKGPRVSTDLSLAGRFLVLVPAADYVAVSKKIESAKERRRLRTLATSLKPEGFGVIVRTVAEGRDAKSLDTDLRLLADKWRKIQNKLDEKPNPPVLLYQDVNMVSSVIRDLFSEDYDRILVDDEKTFRNVQAYVKAVAPQMADKVEFHKGRGQVFRSLGIEKQVEEAFSKRVNMRGGGYLFIETTEAMHVVDVNSGRAGRGKSQKQNLIDVNVEAAREVAKQLRLRDLGGIIVVDFIDLKYDRDRRKVTDALKKAFEKDRAVTKLLPMSDFGLVQITRQRLRPSITAGAVDEDGEPLEGTDAMEAAGAGEIVQPGRSRGAEPEPEPELEPAGRRGGRERAPEPAREPAREVALAPEEATPQALAGRLRGWLDHYRQAVDEKYRGRPVVVRVHPLFGAYLRRGFPSTLTRWRLAIRGIAFSVEEDPGVDPLAFDVRDQKSGRSLLKKYTA